MSRVLKHIPSEIVMVYITVDGVAEREMLQTLLWIVLGVLTVLTPFWLNRVMRVKRPEQLFISTLSVPVWLFALGGPFALQDWYQPAFGAIVLPFYTLIIPIIRSR